jgi:ribosome-associated protein
MKKLSTIAKKKLVIAALEDIKARDIQAIDVRTVTDIFDWIVVASAESARQTKALSRHVRDRLREAGSSIIGTEGEDTGDWILVDAGDVVAHVMQPAVRQYYALEELWGEGKFDDVVNSTVPVESGRADARGARSDDGDEEDAPKPRARKPAVKKPTVKKPAAKKSAAKKPAVKKPAVKKPAAKKPAVKKAAVKKPRRKAA